MSHFCIHEYVKEILFYTRLVVNSAVSLYCALDFISDPDITCRFILLLVIFLFSKVFSLPLLGFTLILSKLSFLNDSLLSISSEDDPLHGCP